MNNQLTIIKDLKPEITTRISELATKLRNIPAIGNQADADAANKVLKDAKSYIKYINAEALEMRRPFSAVVKEIIDIENSAISPLTAMIEVCNKKLVDFAKETDRLKKEAEEKIRKDAEIAAQLEGERVAKIKGLMAKLEKSVLTAIADLTQATAPDKLTKLKSLKFDPIIYMEFVADAEALRATLIVKMNAKLSELNQLAAMAEFDTVAAMELAEKRKAEEAEAIKEAEIRGKTAQEDAKLDAIRQEQMGADLRVSELAGSKSVAKSWKLSGITDIALVPREYMIVDEKAVRAAIKSGIILIPGLLIEEQITNVSR